MGLRWAIAEAPAAFNYLIIQEGGHGGGFAGRLVTEKQQRPTNKHAASYFQGERQINAKANAWLYMMLAKDDILSWYMYMRH